jgi:hypothetical protein
MRHKVLDLASILNHVVHLSGSTEREERYLPFWWIVPTILGEIFSKADKTQAQRVMEVMLKMVKLDIALLKQAYEG